MKNKDAVFNTVHTSAQMHENHHVDESAKKSLPKTLSKHARCLFSEQIKHFKTMFQLLPYKPAQLFCADMDISKQWYIEFYYLKPGTTDNYKRFRKTFAMNRIADAKDRLLFGKEAQKFVNERLKEGFNPFEHSLKGSKSKIPVISDQLQLIIKEQTKTASKTKIKGYTEYYNRFMKFIDACEMQEISMHEFDDHHADAYRDYLDHDLNLSVRTINGSIGYISKFWKYGMKKRWCNQNPFINVERMNKNYKEAKEERFEPLTTEEIDTIFGHLINTNQRNYLRFLAMIFYAWARPVEISRLKVCDVDLSRNLIRFSKAQTKNKQGAFVQIVPPLKKLLQEIKLENYDPDLFIFSGNGAGFAPGKKQLTRNKPSEVWNEIVKKQLKIKKDQYGLKHTGNIDYLLLNKGNVDTKWQQMQNRHTSAGMTERYCRKLNAYFIEVGDLNFKKFE